MGIQEATSIGQKLAFNLPYFSGKLGAGGRETHDSEGLQLICLGHPITMRAV